ncbi:MAG: succinate dehydrogenase cytochrome b subunit [Geobacteraceae bacterium]
MQLLNSNVGRKILMAITGQLMVLFVIVHLLGNSSIFIGPDGINSYAEHLHSLGPLVWAFRLAMLTFLLVHVIYGIQVTLENNAANPSKYAVNRKLKAGFASENMIWTGLLLAAFIVYHLLQFTIRATPDVAAFVGQIPGNVFGMVTASFSHGIIVFIYVAAMVALFLHLSHGIQSFFQTMGWNNERSLPVISMVGKVIAVVFLVGYSSIPVFILAGILK